MPIKIFFCYAHEDEPLLNKLKAHLRPLQRQGLVDVWYDRNISAGTDWEQEIKEQLNTAQIILLLVSPDFIDSDYCYGNEMQRAIERDKRGEARVIPVILRPVDFEVTPLRKLQALPTDAKAVMSSSWQYQDEAFVNVTKGIRKVVEELSLQQHSPNTDKEQFVQQPNAWDAQSQAPQQVPGWGAQNPAPQQPATWGTQGSGSVGGHQPWDVAASPDPWAQQGQGASSWGQQSNQPASPSSYGSGSGSGQSWAQPAQVTDQWGQPVQQGFGASPFDSPDVDKTILRSTVGAQGIGFVRIEEGTEPGRVYEVRKESLSIGRSRESDIFLEDLAVSGLHASIISLGNNNYALRDEGSANGTKVNGQPLSKYQNYPLQDEDKIQLGETVLVFCLYQSD